MQHDPYSPLYWTQRRVMRVFVAQLVVVGLVGLMLGYGLGKLF